MAEGVEAVKLGGRVMKKQKNVLFLVLDSLRKDRTSVYNTEVDFTPNLQELAESSRVFGNAVAQAPWTLPSHASIFTGDYPWEHGINQSRTYFEDEETFIQQFNDEGYRTAAITPNVWITPHKGTTKDFDYVENFFGKIDNSLTVKISKMSTKLFDALGKTKKKRLEKYLDTVFQYFDLDNSCKSEETVEEVERYLADVEDDFFLYVNLMEPHEPYHPPKKFQEKHGVEDKSKVPQRQKDLFTKDIDFQELRKIYDASVEYTDELVGRVLDALEENGLREETVVFVLSDHGQALGEDGIFGHQFTVDDSVTDVVMMVDDPEEEPGNEDEMFELRKLNDLTPYYAGIDDKPQTVFTDKAKGQYSYPTVFIGYVPEEEWGRYYRKFQYFATRDEKAVRSIDQDGESEYRSHSREDGEVVEKSDLEQEFGGFGEGSLQPKQAQTKDTDQDEEIKRRLEDLGYS